MKYYLGLFVIVISVYACSDPYSDVSVDSALIPYIERFEQEAVARGVKFDINEEGIDAKIAHIPTNGVLGYCNHKKDENNLITISKLYWEKATDLEREYVVFHELGHCFLDREHFDDEDKAGVCISIMAAGTSTCAVNYTVKTRAALLDELFK